jgi:DNA (cytosine-5)-methyltransferase 1
MKKSSRPICIDLFAGAGGMSLGFEQAGFDIVAAVEIDPIHSATHHFNFPKSKVICESVVNLRGDDIRRRANLGNVDIDIVVGGAPCQGFSLIGKRLLDDPRNSLVLHFVRLVQELQPKYVVFENVKGLTLGKHAKFLQEVVVALGESEYEVVLPYKVLNAARFGVPQSRERLFLLAARKGMQRPAYPNENIVRSATVADAISDLPDADTFSELAHSDSVPAHWKTKSEYARILRGLITDTTDFSFPRKFDQNVLSSSLRTFHTDLSKLRFSETANGETEPISRFRKLAMDGLCNTLRAGTDSARGAFTSPRPIHPTYDRVITVREAARLHSYPDWFRFHKTKWHGFRQIGNSVPPLLARAVAREIISALGHKPKKPSETITRVNEYFLELDMGSAARLHRVSRHVIAQRRRASNSNVSLQSELEYA